MLSIIYAMALRPRGRPPERVHVESAGAPR
ncbi:MAG: hypothetical protein ACJAYU_001445 [Bradymonadia bacterium]